MCFFPKFLTQQSKMDLICKTSKNTRTVVVKRLCVHLTLIKMSTKLEVLWTSQPNKFITWGSEICLYEVHTLKDSNYTGLKLSNTSGASLISTNNNTNHNYIKCLDVYPRENSDVLLAIGHTNGRVALSTFGSSEFDYLGLPGKELVPRHPRPCNVVSFNPIDNNLLAVGLDKYRTDYSVLLWDVMKHPVNDNNSRLAVSTMQPAVELAKPIAEFGISETTHSLAWFNANSKLMAVGMNMKYIKLLDFRDPNKVVNTSLTKAVNGLCLNPQDDKYLASFVENQIFIWDTRNFEKPIVMLPHTKSLLKIAWCPTKYNMLGALQKDSSLVKLYDIQHTVVGNEEIEPQVLDRDVAPGSPHNITSFSWHHSDENRFLTIAISGSIVDYTVFDRITLNWAPTSNIVWTYGRKTMKCVSDIPLKDISTTIKERALKGYGLNEELWKNADIVDNDMLKNVWNWLYLSGKLAEEGILRGSNVKPVIKHPGVQAVLKTDSGGIKSEMILIPWADLGNINCHGSARIFRHEDRSKSLHLCSWHFERDPSLMAKFLDQLEKDKAYTRAAAIAIFNLKIKLAIDILGRAPDNNETSTNLSVAGLALAGFSDDKNSAWKQFSSTMLGRLTDPYLRAIFAFLTAENYNYDSILFENGMTVDDRVAFACIFLADNKLNEYLKKLSDKLIEEGNLDGLLLTGNNGDGIKLLQRYFYATGDIQSTTLIAIRAFSSDIFSDTITEWIESYRNLLDTWKLWRERSQFDIMLSTYRPSEKIPQQVYISCNFCGKSISALMETINIPREQQQQQQQQQVSRTTNSSTTSNTLKMCSCPNCRKPLPRCAICLMHMGTSLEGSLNNIPTVKIIKFADWFTWCQSCRHGGHASHMVHWFKEHAECPVTACQCRCISVDAISNALVGI